MHSIPNDASVFANVMPTGPPPAIRTGTSFMGFLHISGWTYSARRAADLCSGSRRPDGGPSSLSGRRLLHSANHISGDFAGWQVLFFATVLFFARAKPVDACEAARGSTRP